MPAPSAIPRTWVCSDQPLRQARPRRSRKASSSPLVGRSLLPLGRLDQFEGGHRDHSAVVLDLDLGDADMPTLLFRVPGRWIRKLGSMLTILAFRGDLNMI